MPTPPRFPRQLLEALEAAGLRVGDVLTPETIDRLAAELAEADVKTQWARFEASLPPESPAEPTEASSWPGAVVVSN